MAATTMAVIGTGLTAKGAVDQNKAGKERKKELEDAQLAETARKKKIFKEAEGQAQERQTGGFMSALGAGTNPIA